MVVAMIDVAQVGSEIAAQTVRSHPSGGVTIAVFDVAGGEQPDELGVLPARPAGVGVEADNHRCAGEVCVGCRSPR